MRNKKMVILATVIVIFLFNVTVTANSEILYTDSDTGVTLMIPEHWREKSLLKEREFIDIKLVHDYEPNLMITYGSFDLWSQMTFEEKKVFSSRAEFNMSLFHDLNDAELKQVLFNDLGEGQQVNDLKRVTINNVEYYEVVVIQSLESYGYLVESPFTSLVHIKDGWWHQFQFSGTKEDKYYTDFLELVNSANYSLSSEKFSTTPNAYTNSTSVFVGVVALLIFVPTIVFIFNKIKKNKIKTTCCRKCGKCLTLDSKFCHVCGAKIELEE